MRVLGHIHSFNDADIIDRTIESFRQQTQRLDEILLVDNASSDGTLDAPAIRGITVIRHAENGGTSGAVVTGMRYALERGYDWIWVLDADSLVLPDALEKLLELYAGLPPEQQKKTAFLACMARNQPGNEPWYGSVFTERGIEVVDPPLEHRHFLCNSYIWSGCLYSLAAVRQFGLPNADYVLDCGEDEYGYRIMQAGYNGFIDRDAVLLHNIRGMKSLNPTDLQVGLTTVRAYEFPPIRCYYMCRNALYFVLYEFAKGRFGLLRGVLWRMRRRRKLGPARGVVWSVLLLTANFLVRPFNHRRQIHACVRGIWHGVTGNIGARY
jgi:GT2 family glycosyltransferase